MSKLFYATLLHSHSQIHFMSKMKFLCQLIDICFSFQCWEGTTDKDCSLDNIDCLGQCESIHGCFIDKKEDSSVFGCFENRNNTHDCMFTKGYGKIFRGNDTFRRNEFLRKFSNLRKLSIPRKKFRSMCGALRRISRDQM